MPDHRDQLYAAPVEIAGALPAKADLLAQCPAVYDQGQLGSCTANAIAGAIQFDRMKQKLADIFTPSRLFIYYNERAIEHSVNSDSGAQIRDGIKSVGKQADCPETEWPYVIAKFKTKPPKNCYADALKYRAVLSTHKFPLRVTTWADVSLIKVSKGSFSCYGNHIHTHTISGCVNKSGINIFSNYNNRIYFNKFAMSSSFFSSFFQNP